jgi:hypothetical protein
MSQCTLMHADGLSMAVTMLNLFTDAMVQHNIIVRGNCNDVPIAHMYLNTRLVE